MWEGKLQTKKTGTHKFQLYASSYFKLFADGKPMVDGWRQNWNAWYHNFELPMTAGKPVSLRVEWIPNDGHIALLHNDPLPEHERYSLTLASEVAPVFREYERALTATVNAYLRPVCQRYLAALAPLAEEVLVLSSAAVLVGGVGHDLAIFGCCHEGAGLRTDTVGRSSSTETLLLPA